MALKSGIIYFSIFVIINCLTHQVNAQNAILEGTVQTEKGEPLPYANVVILELSKGTSSNFDGQFRLELKPGTHKISFQYVGFESQTIEVTLGPNETRKLIIRLNEEKLYLSTIVVKANSEDPAYAIIRNAQNKRKEHLEEHKNIRFSAYTKLFGKSATGGSPKVYNMFGTMLEKRKGVFYLSESVFDLFQFDANNTSEILIASLVKGDSLSFSQNKSVFINLYENRPFSVAQGAVVTRIISPIASDAMSFYDYEYIGSFQEDEMLVHKIRLIPKTTSKNTFSGTIYIIDQSWRILKSQNFVNSAIGNLEINTAFIENKEGQTFLPLSTSFILKEDSDNVQIYHHNVFYDYQFDAPTDLHSANQNFSVANEGIQKSNEWWKEIRPIELTEDEALAYLSFGQVEKSIFDFDLSEQADSLLDLQSSKFNMKILYDLLLKKEYQFNEKWALDVRIINFNTVEGFVLKPHVKYNTSLSNKKQLNADFYSRYGFASNRFYAKTKWSYELSPIHVSKWGWAAGSYIEQISGANSITDFWNMVYTLDNRINHQKLYERNFVGLQYQRELLNGLDLSISSSYNLRNPLQNNTDFSFIAAEETGAEFTPNMAFINGEFVDFERSRLVRSEIKFSYQPKRRFNLIEGRKIPLSSAYPKFSLIYEMGYLDAQYQRFVINMSHFQNLGAIGMSRLSLSYGQFLSANNLTPIDFMHFMGNQIFVYQTERRYGLSYQLLDYYALSTDSYFAGANFEHDFDGAILGRVPLLKRLGLKSYFIGNYLFTSEYAHYGELGFGLSTSYFPLKMTFLWGINSNMMPFGLMLHQNL